MPLLVRNCVLLACAILLLACAQPARSEANRASNNISADGGKYSGALVDGLRHGRGRLEWTNGSSYDGGFEQGLYSGRGKLISAAGDKYEGNFEKGLMSGRGSLEYKSGAKYIGEFRNGTLHGQGRLQYATGEVYEGPFENGLSHGNGKLTRPAGIYTGDFREGVFWGQGKLTYTDGRKYSGEFMRGDFQGKGRFETPAGDVYEGSFVKGEFTGANNTILRRGSRYQGSALKWKPHGKGSYTDASGNVYEGLFINGELFGKAKLAGKDGTRYEGDFKNFAFHGQGVLKLANGDQYTGAFEHGTYQGSGTLTYAKAQPDGRMKDSGTWQFGVLENKELERQSKSKVETALYNQRNLLDKALAGLTPENPKKIDLFLLAVAGDGSQEVFRREVEFVRTQFDRDFDTQGHSLALINSRNTVDTAPMATVTSIREALQGVAARMNKQQDVLFLFLTSHGSREFELTLDQNGMNLRDLPAKELGTLLKESGIRWKVVVVSACYSGGFIDAIKDDTTMVITAARHDRTSFGCSDDNDFTYFGRAFFKEALPQAASFSDAFNKSQKLVQKWETADIKTGEKANESLPQIHNPPAIEAYLKQWRAQLPPQKPSLATTQAVTPKEK